LTRDAVAAGLVTVETSGLLPRRHRLLAAGRPLGELAFGTGSSVLYADAGGRRLRMARISLWRAEYGLWEGEGRRPLARATFRPLKRRGEVAWGGQSFQLRPADLRATSWELRSAAGELALTIRWCGWGRAEIEVHGAVDTGLLAFAYYLAVIRRRAAWRRGG